MFFKLKASVFAHFIPAPGGRCQGQVAASHSARPEGEIREDRGRLTCSTLLPILIITIHEFFFYDLWTIAGLRAEQPRTGRHRQRAPEVRSGLAMLPKDPYHKFNPNGTNTLLAPCMLVNVCTVRTSSNYLNIRKFFVYCCI